MNEKSIKKLRSRFILYSMCVLLVVMFTLSGLIYLTNTMVAKGNIRHILTYIVRNDGEVSTEVDLAGRMAGQNYDFLHFFAEVFQSESKEMNFPETHFLTRYFVVLLDEDGEIQEVRIVHMDELTEDEARAYARKALKKSRKFGQDGYYYYQVEHRKDGSGIVVYLDATYQLTVTRRLLYSGLILVGFFLIVSLIFISVISGKAIRPEIRNMEMQKQFITNASHELKTPLAVIKANTEMQEILEGESEWTQSTLRQVDRMTGLIQNLVQITRAQEVELETEALNDRLDVSNVVLDTVKTFVPVAANEDKSLEWTIPDNVHMKAAESQIRQLTSLLVDNAIKYCDEKGQIRVTLAQRGRGCMLTVSNSYADGASVDYSRFFERFYRQDTSHNTDRGGYGIGLSIAENIVTEQYRGRIQASWKNGEITFTCQLRAHA